MTLRGKAEAPSPPFFLADMPWQWTFVSDGKNSAYKKPLLLYHHHVALDQPVPTAPLSDLALAENQQSAVVQQLLHAVSDIRLTEDESSLTAILRSSSSFSQQQSLVQVRFKVQALLLVCLTLYPHHPQRVSAANW